MQVGKNSCKLITLHCSQLASQALRKSVRRTFSPSVSRSGSLVGQSDESYTKSGSVVRQTVFLCFYRSVSWFGTVGKPMNEMQIVSLLFC